MYPTFIASITGKEEKKKVYSLKAKLGLFELIWIFSCSSRTMVIDSLSGQCRNSQERTFHFLPTINFRISQQIYSGTYSGASNPLPPSLLYQGLDIFSRLQLAKIAR